MKYIPHDKYFLQPQLQPQKRSYEKNPTLSDSCGVEIWETGRYGTYLHFNGLFLLNIYLLYLTLEEIIFKLSDSTGRTFLTVV